MEKNVGHRGILIGRLNRVESWRCRERNRHKHAHMCAVYGNEIDVKGDQRKKRTARKKIGQMYARTRSLR